MNRQTSFIALAGALAISTIAAPVYAQDADDGAQEQGADQEVIEDDVHDRRVDYQGNIIVSAVGLAQFDLLAGTSVFEAGEIQQNLSSTH